MKFLKLFFIISLLTCTAVETFSQDAIKLYGSVVIDGNKPAAGYRVYVIDGNNNWVGPALTDQKGMFVFYDIQNGKYKLVIYKVGLKGENIEKWKGRVNVPSGLKTIKIKK